MKRSRINQIIRDANAFLRSLYFRLPPFAYWTPDEWRDKGPEVREIVDCQMGWDITDFGSGDFDKVGLFLFTIRNGPADGSGKSYAEKIMIVQPDQVTPMHFHWKKQEDIINRGGGTLAIKVYNSAEDEQLADTPVTVTLDGVVQTVPAGTILRLNPGESITLTTGMYHSFWAEETMALVGEVSDVNDDTADNRFLEAAGRFPAIEEDEPPQRLLVGDYVDYYRFTV
jgi:D-lyxose ketol-isomerase